MAHRECTNCNEGMDEGYCIGDGESYACSDKCLFIGGYTIEARDRDYEEGFIYWTTWEEE
jgi:hypothetical protein